MYTVAKTDETGNYSRSATNEGALLNINNSALDSYKKMKKRMKKLDRVEELETKVEQLTQLVEKLLNDRSNS